MTKPDQGPDRLELADYRARCFVNGTKRSSVSGKIEPRAGDWSSVFYEHPYVVDAEYEGWGRELRAVVIRAVKMRILAGADYSDINALMPDREWVDYAKDQAERGRKAKRWRDETFGPPGNTDEIVKSLRAKLQNAARNSEGQKS